LFGIGGSWIFGRMSLFHFIKKEMKERANNQNPEERVDHLQKAAKFFGEHKDRAFEAKVRLLADHVWKKS
jgi:hypothetical protein